MSFWKLLNGITNRHSVLRHPFYLRWSAGAVTPDELAHYSGQYRRAVVALADAAASAACSAQGSEDHAALIDHAVEERRHVALWDEFVVAAGGDPLAEPTPETRECAATWAGTDERPLSRTLVAMYAIESAQPELSAARRMSLAEHYGITADAYFRLHEQLDLEHATELRAMIDKRLSDANQDALLATAEDVLIANWRLLDGVERRHNPHPARSATP